MGSVPVRFGDTVFSRALKVALFFMKVGDFEHSKDTFILNVGMSSECNLILQPLFYAVALCLCADFVLLLDVDFIPSRNLDTVLRAYAGGLLSSAGREGVSPTALILPALLGDRFAPASTGPLYAV